VCVHDRVGTVVNLIVVCIDGPEVAELIEEVRVLATEVAWAGVTEVVGDLPPCLARRKLS
jgi:hypothetical protein